MKGKVSLAVVIPFIRVTLSESEKTSLTQWQKHLSDFPTFTLSPPNLQPPHKKMKPVYFPAENFTSVRKYSELMLKEEFYRRFEKYDYILIYQLDALIFSSDFAQFFSEKTSYVGAPWFNTVIGSLCSPTPDLRGGNGGFSLRSVKESLKVISNLNASAKFQLSAQWKQYLWFVINLIFGQTHLKWLNCPAHHYPFNEDGFWSFEASKYSDSFKPAPRELALKFSFETHPEVCFELNHNKLPVGTHAWEKYDKKFWQAKLTFLS